MRSPIGGKQSSPRSGTLEQATRMVADRGCLGGPPAAKGLKGVPDGSTRSADYEAGGKSYPGSWNQAKDAQEALESSKAPAVVEAAVKAGRDPR